MPRQRKADRVLDDRTHPGQRTVQLLTQAERERREKERTVRRAARASRTAPVAAPVLDALPSSTVWRARDLPQPRTASAGVPLSEGVASVLIGAVAYVPVALLSGYAAWNYPVAAVLVLALSYALCSRRVVVGTDFLAVRKFGPYRLASAGSITRGALRPTQTQTHRGGVLLLGTGDGRTMRLRRAEYTRPEVNRALRALVLRTGRAYDEGVQRQLDLPWREDFGHHRYLLDAVQ